MNTEDIKNYVERYLRRIFVEPINITVEDNKYIINNTLRYEIYNFWNKTDEELLNDFKEFSFKEDYIGTIFFFLSGYWEYTHNNIKDEYERFPAIESFSYKKDVLEEPVVDILVESIRKELDLNYKEDKPKAFLTHDIDNLGLPKGWKFLKSLGGDILKRKDIKLGIDRIKRKITNQDPWSVYNLIELHKRYDTKGTFFFMPDIQTKNCPGGYDPFKNQGYLKELKKGIKTIDGRIGLHYDVRHLKEDRMKNDLEKLNQIFETKIEYGRAHFLLFDITKSFDIYEKAGIKIDSTCSYADRVGFRFGTSKPFMPYNFKEKRDYNLLEIPLIVMEGSLQNPRYMDLSSKEGFEKIKELIQKIKKYNGTFTLLWHNSSFYTTEWKDWEWVFFEKVN
jgi:hypothetical protein